MEDKLKEVLEKVVTLSTSMSKLQSDIDFASMCYAHVPGIKRELELAQAEVDKSQRLLMTFYQNSTVKS